MAQLFLFSNTFKERRKHQLFLGILCFLLQGISLAQNVGIGTTQPQARLHVLGDVLVDDGNLLLTNRDIKGVNLIEANQRLFMRANPTSSSTAILTDQGLGLSVSPTERLHVNGNLRLDNGEIQLQNNHIKGLNTLEGANDLFFRSRPGNNVSMFINSADRIGIGTLAPTAKLHVKGNLKIEEGILKADTLEGTNGLFLKASPNNAPVAVLKNDRLEVAGDVKVAENLRVNQAVSVGGDHTFSIDAPSFPGGRFFIATDGQIGIHTTDPTFDLHVNGSTRVESQLSLGSNAPLQVDAPFNPGGRFAVNNNGLAGFGVVRDGVRLAVMGRVGDNRQLEVDRSDGSSVFEVGDFGIGVAGLKLFVMDHPVEPADKILLHYCTESPEPYNTYSGVATLGPQGKAVVQLPSYFEALNKDFRYQLTCVGGYAPVYISQTVAQNRFEIAGGTPGLKVSWEVTGTRNDVFAREHPPKAEVEKPASQKGKFLYPKGFGKTPADTYHGAYYSNF